MTTYQRLGPGRNLTATYSATGKLLDATRTTNNVNHPVTPSQWRYLQTLGPRYATARA